MTSNNTQPIPDDLFSWVDLIQTQQQQTNFSQHAFQFNPLPLTDFSSMSSTLNYQMMLMTQQSLPQQQFSSPYASPPQFLASSSSPFQFSPYQKKVSNGAGGHVSSLPKKKPGRKPKAVTELLPTLTQEEKKVDRMVKNREAADLSRQRRREKMTVLEQIAWKMCAENDDLKAQIRRLERHV